MATQTQFEPPWAPPTSPPAEQKFSRYRSVRHAKTAQQPTPLPSTMAEDTSTPAQPMSRSMSRYHRARPATAAGPHPQAVPTMPSSATRQRGPSETQRSLLANQQQSAALPSQISRQDRNHPPTLLSSLPSENPTPPQTAKGTPQQRVRAMSTPQKHASPTSPTAARSKPSNSPKAVTRVPTDPRTGQRTTLVEQSQRRPDTTGREEARKVMANEAERQRKMQAKIRAERKLKLEAEEAERKVAEEEEQARIEAEAQAMEKRRAQQQEEGDRRAREQERKAKEVELSNAVKPQAAPRKTAVSKSADPQMRPKAADVLGIAASSPPVSPPTQKYFEPEEVPKPSVFGFLKRKRGDQAPQSSNILGNAQPRQVSDPKKDEPITIKPGGGGVVPGTDAPISAVNAGDRRVLVECGRSSMMFPVTPTTTPSELIRSASTVMSEQIDPKASVVLESFSKVGVQRPLRLYEHVRDVMNSWDNDTQNSLIIVPSATGGLDHDLRASAVSAERPAPFSCYMHYSQRPGKWSKRWVILQSDGQMLWSKAEGSKEVNNICHLSDFDIYTPTAKQAAKKVRPPKKFCFAVKSLQKSTMFETTTSYVHFFCTNDKRSGGDFYTAVQGWRSWYLVHVMGEGQKKAKLNDAQADAGAPAERDFVNKKAAPGHRRSISMDSHYQLGTFSPLLDLSQFDTSQGPTHQRKASNTFADDMNAALDTKAMHTRKMSVRNNSHPPVAFQAHHLSKPSDATHASSSRLNSLSQTNSRNSGEAFTSGGLLGRKYSQRRKAQEERERQHGGFKPDGPFTNGPSLLNNIDTAYTARVSMDNDRPTRMASVRSSHGRRDGSVEMSRSRSVKRPDGPPPGMPKPLVDLTPKFIEPIHHRNKGKGVKVEPGSGPLVEVATTPEIPIQIPPSSDWRRPGTSSGHQGAGSHQRSNSVNRGSRERTLSLRGPRVNNIANNHDNVPENSFDAFTGKGLLAATAPGQGDVAKGHGVADGSKAKAPLMNMSEQSQFAKGSLLERVERQVGIQGPVIDREKRNEVEIEVGEAM